MKKQHLAWTVFLVCAMLLIPGAAKAADGAIVVDHSCTDIWQIPESAIEQARDSLHIAYGHTSHGSQLISGMGSSGTQLDAFMTDNGASSGLYVWHDGPQAGALDLDNYFVSGDLGNPDRVTWAQRTRDYLDDPDNADVNVVIWSWCGQVDGSESDIDTYLELMNGLEADYPHVRFVYMTGHLNGTGETGNVNVRNNQIRQYCIDNNKILYDFADIESYDPDGEIDYMVLNANDNCDYDSDGNGSRDANWAADWQNSHVQGVDWWASGAAHSQHLNGNLKGYAAWWLWAKLAGWNTCIPAPSDLTAEADSSAGTVTLSWIDNSEDLDVDLFVIQRKVNDDEWDDDFANISGDGSTFVDQFLAPGSYSYRVVAYVADNGQGESCYSTVSNIATAQILSEDPPAPPSDLVGVAHSSGSFIDLTWSDNSNNETGFILSRRFDDQAWDESFATLAADVVSYRDSSLSPGVYVYRIRALNQYGQSDDSNETDELAIVDVPEVPAAPSDLESTLDGFDIALTWIDNSDNEDGFVLERKIDDNDFSVLDDSIASDSQSYLDSGLAPLHTYTYRIKAANEYGVSDPSNETSKYLAEQSVTITLKQNVDGYTGCRDAYLEEAHPAFNYGGDPYNYVRNSPKINFLSSFDLPEQVLGKRILEARIGFYCWSVSYYAEGQYLDLYRVNAYWEEGTANGAYQQGSASWNVRAADSAVEIPWQTPGGDFDEELLGRSLIASSGYYPEFDITGLVQQWADGALDNYGVLLKNDSVVRTGIKASEYSEYGRPYLNITYTAASGSDCTLAVSSTEGGSVAAPGEGTFTYECGTAVALVAEAIEGFQFAGWTGDVEDPESARTSITLDGDRKVVANFERVIVTCELAVSSTEGGSVVVPGEGTFTYECGTAVKLVAEALDGYEFAGWTGEVEDPESARTSITLDGDKKVVANFERVIVTCELAVSSTEGGSVVVPGEGSFTYECGTTVALVAKALDGYEFAEWTGDVEDPESAQTVIKLDGDKKVVAAFEKIVVEYELTIASSTGGSVTVPGEGVFLCPENMLVELEATADEGYEFSSWTGDVADPDSPITTVVVDEDKEVRANFTPVATPSMAAHYKFDNNYLDSSGNGNHGVNNGSVFTGGKIDQAAFFDGFNDYVSAENSPSLDFTGEITLSAWVYYVPQNRGLATIVSKMRNHWGWQYSCFALGVHGDYVRYGTDGKARRSKQRLETGLWHHLVMTHCQGVTSLYIDGVLDSAAKRQSFVRSSVQPLAIGGRLFAGKLVGQYTGQIDDVRIYNTALSADAVMDLYAQAPVSPVTNLAATPADATVELSWSNPVDENFYGVLIQRTAGPEDGFFYEIGESLGDSVVVYEGPEETFTDEGLLNGINYQYRVFAIDIDGNYSSPASIVSRPDF